MPVNYYIIRAYNGKGQSGSSFSAMSQLVDSFPPMQPQKPIASIDTLGNVYLSWKKGKEEDIAGYRVFRSNFIDEEFGQVTHDPVKDTLFIEKIGLNNLSKNIYYRIAAIDRNFNQSELSNPVMLIKPDIIPPSPPLFKSAKSENIGAKLEWINSSSNDVAKHVLYRREPSKEKWVTIAVFPVLDSVFSFTDKQIQAKILYEYTLLAVDSANNESKPCKSVFVSKIDNGKRPTIENIKADIDLYNKWIKISWEYNYLDVKNFMVYRSSDQNQLQYYKMVSASTDNFKDTNVIMNTIYKYRLKAVFSDGSESGFSDEIIVTY
jgi:fibronectin type 3 domain-containing protein